jgi:hypothetical protein
MKTKRRILASVIALGVSLLTAASSYAGPFILAGTDADDHGSVSGGVNQDGWFFMQRALENIAPGVTNGNKVVVFLGSDSGFQAGNAAASAFGLSNLVAAGWTSQFVNGAEVNTLLSGGTIGSGLTLAQTGILMMDSGGNVSGGANGTEIGYFTSNAGAINSFLGAGGGLFSQSNGYGWVSALLPTLGVTNQQNDGLALTAAGNAAFPGLTNADLSAGPWHNYFSNTGGLPILAVSTDTSAPGVPVILGASGGTVTNPDPVGVPDGGSLFAPFALVLGLLAGARRFFAKSAA